MKLEEQNIMFFSRSIQHGGTEVVLLQLCEILKPFVNKIVVVSADGIRTEELYNLGIKHYSISDISKKSLINFVSVIRLIKQIVENESITVIHTHHRMAAFYVRILGLDKKHIFINTSHGVFFDKRLLTKFAYKNARVIACGEMVKRNLTGLYGIQNVHVIRNAVKSFDGNVIPEQEMVKAYKEGKNIIGNVGRLSKEKGFEFYLQAIRIVIMKHPNSVFYIIGSGSLENRLKRLSKGLPVVFLGNRSDVQSLLSQMDFVVLSSLTEGLPLVPIETFSVGKTIVATETEGTIEIIDNKSNGLLAKSRNSEDLANKICWMIEHPEERIRMEKNAFKSFCDDYSYDVMRDSYISYYKSI